LNGPKNIWFNISVSRWAVYGSGLSMAQGCLWLRAVYGSGLSMAQGCLWLRAVYSSGLFRGRNVIDDKPQKPDVVMVALDPKKFVIAMYAIAFS
jgi:hypothetical protein